MLLDDIPRSDALLVAKAQVNCGSCAPHLRNTSHVPCPSTLGPLRVPAAKKRISRHCFRRLCGGGFATSEYNHRGAVRRCTRGPRLCYTHTKPFLTLTTAPLSMSSRAASSFSSATAMCSGASHIWMPPPPRCHMQRYKQLQRSSTYRVLGVHALPLGNEVLKSLHITLFGHEPHVVIHVDCGLCVGHTQHVGPRDATWICTKRRYRVCQRRYEVSCAHTARALANNAASRVGYCQSVVNAKMNETMCIWQKVNSWPALLPVSFAQLCRIGGALLQQDCGLRYLHFVLQRGICEYFRSCAHASRWRQSQGWPWPRSGLACRLAAAHTPSLRSR